MQLNFRNYAALYYLKNGRYDFFNELLLKDLDDKKYFVDNVKLLIKEGYVVKSGKRLYITKKGEDLVKRKNKPVQTSKDWIDQYRKLFPSNRMGSKNEVINEMDKFINTHNFTKEEILQGTQEYINKESLQNFMYVTTSVNFIKGTAKNKLETYCEYIRLEKDDDLSMTNGKLLE